MFEYLVCLLPLLLGAVFGWVGGLLGIGGGLIAIPILVLFFDMSQQLAQGTALIMITPNVMLAFWRYHQRHPMPLARIAGMLALSLPSSWAAARLAVHLDSHVLTQVFAAFLFLLSFYFFFGQQAMPGADQPGSKWPLRYLPLVGVLSGFSAGFFSVGAGLVASPLLVRGFRLSMAQAQGMALSVVVPGALVSLGTFAQAHQVDWSTGLLLAAGGALSISSGVALAHRLPEHQLKRLFATMLLLTAGLMLRASFS